MADTFTERVGEFFQQRPGQWIDGRDLEPVGGRYAWRSRVSNCRTQLGMRIDNRVRKVPGSLAKVSEYCFVPADRLF